MRKPVLVTILFGVLSGLLVVSAACTPAAPTPKPESPKSAAPAAAPAAATKPGSRLDQLYEAAQAKGEREVVWQVNMAPENFRTLVAAFEQRFPGIKLTIINVAGPQIGQRIITEATANRVTIDVGSGGIYQVGPLLVRDLLKPIDFTGTGVDPKDIVLDGKMVFATELWLGIMYNTKVVAEKDVPRKWEDLLDPKWEGKIGVQGTGSGWDGLSAVLNDQEFEEYMKKLAKQKPVIGVRGADNAKRLQSGELAIGSGNFNYIAEGKAEGAPVDVAPIGPVASLPINSFTTKKSPHPTAAELLILWMNSPEWKGTPEATKLAVDSGWGPVTPCGPSGLDQVVCDKKFEVYRLDTIDKAERSEKITTIVAKTVAGMK